MARKKTGIDIEDMMEMLIGQIAGMDRKELRGGIDSEYERHGLDMTSKHHKTKMSTARKKYTLDYSCQPQRGEILQAKRVFIGC